MTEKQITIDYTGLAQALRRGRITAANADILQQYMDRALLYIRDSEPAAAPLKIKLTYRENGYYGATARSTSIVYLAGTDEAYITLNCYVHTRNKTEVLDIVKSMLKALVWTYTYHTAEKLHKEGRSAAKQTKGREDDIVNLWMDPLYAFVKGHKNLAA
jgi:hypothetical protein